MKWCWTLKNSQVFCRLLLLTPALSAFRRNEISLFLLIATHFRCFLLHIVLLTRTLLKNLRTVSSLLLRIQKDSMIYHFLWWKIWQQNLAFANLRNAIKTFFCPVFYRTSILFACLITTASATWWYSHCPLESIVSQKPNRIIRNNL